MLSSSVTTRIIEPRSELGVDRRNRVWLKDLINVTEALTQAGVRYWLDMGTLLGAVREGKFLEWDDDIDLSIEMIDSQKVLKLTPAFAALGYRVDVTDASIYLSDKKRGVVIGIAFYQGEIGQVHWIQFFVTDPLFKPLFTHLRRVAEKIIYSGYHQSLPAVERWFYQLTPSWLRWPLRRLIFRLSAMLGEKHFAMVLPSSVFRGFVEIDFYGLKFKAPDPIEEYLTHIYGQDWRTPNPNWRWKDVKAIDWENPIKNRARYSLFRPYARD